MAKANGEPLKRSFSTRKTDSAAGVRLTQWSVAIGLLLCLTALMVPRGTLPFKELHVGDIVPRDIKANRDILVEDVESTAKIKAAAGEAVKEIFDLEPKLAEEISGRARAALEKVRKGYETHAAEVMAQGESPEGPPAAKRPPADLSGLAAQFERTQTYKNLEAEFFASLRIEPSPSLLRFLRARRYDPALADGVGFLLRAVMEPGIVSTKKLLEPHAGKGVLVQVVGEKELKAADDPLRFRDLKEAAGDLPALAEKAGVGPNPEARRHLVLLARRLLEPNLTVNKQATETLRERARQEAKPVFFQLKKGEMIAREGERLTPQQVVKLRGLAAQEEKRGFAGYVLGNALLIALALALAGIYLMRFKRKLMQSPRRVVLMGVMLLGTMIVILFFMQVSVMFSGAMGGVDPLTYYYAIPFATGAMLAAILLDLEVALLFSALTAFFSGLLIPQTFGIPVAALVGGLVAGFRVNYYRRRSSILLTGFLVGLAVVAVIVPLNLIEGRLLSNDGLFAVLMGITGGAIVGMVVSASLPLLESTFSITSDIKLLELGDLDHPLLRQLVMSAPGTYHHSVVVSSLAEEAAELIGANPLLVRVAAYYHDIGKIRKPEYFIENQSGLENKHDRLAPRMSALILISHVKDGIELAHRHNLPEQIIDFIPQHHGTGLISYFYNKAKEMEGPAQQSVNEDDFRYPGPKPQSRETGILLLADAVEAASRTLIDPTPARIQNMVRNIVARIFADGQLDDCELTLRDLNSITKAFVRILTGIFHQRVAYPQTERPGQRGLEAHLDADFGDASAGDGQDRSALDRAQSPEVVRTSGLSG
ncbi:MAG: HDIG domain-containing protein [Candidatus Tectomicrobia bacterium]|nr:HDIG domain-containing protein [Candidatus Tectomicrobia bacterium]